MIVGVDRVDLGGADGQQLAGVDDAPACAQPAAAGGADDLQRRVDRRVDPARREQGAGGGHRSEVGGREDRGCLQLAGAKAEGLADRQLELDVARFDANELQLQRLGDRHREHGMANLIGHRGSGWVHREAFLVDGNGDGDRALRSRCLNESPGSGSFTRALILVRSAVAEPSITHVACKSAGSLKASGLLIQSKLQCRITFRCRMAFA